ncbi:MAG: branched-chain amino acid ABC transporter permease [Rubrivivax sp.]
MTDSITAKAWADPAAAPRGSLRRPAALGLLLLAAAALPWLTASAFHLHLANLVLLNAILVLGFALVASVGQFSLCHAALAGLGGYVSAVVTTRLGLAPLAGVALGAVGAGFVACLLGLLILRLRGVYFVLVTFLVGQAFHLIALNLESLTGGANGIVGIRTVSLFGKALGSRGDFYLFLLACLLLTLALVWLLMASTYGRAFKSIAENALLADACGMNIRRLQVIAFTVGSAIAGAAGALQTHYMRYISPDSFTFHESVLYITMFVLGGRHRLAGALLGAALLTPLPELLREFAGWQHIVYGAVLIVALIFLPGGLVSLPQRLRQLRDFHR